MKSYNSIVSLLLVPVALFAQTSSSSVGSSIDSVNRSNTTSGVLSNDAEVLMALPGQGADSGEASVEDETISVDYPDEDVRTILRSVADLYDLNLVIPDGLQGRTSIKLRNITWDQVFEVVLDPLGYTFIEDRNIIRVKSIEELTAEPVDTRIFVLNYARAEELKDSIESLVDPAAGGNIQVDVRSNSLIVKERPSRMGKINDVIKNLDKATDQVMIESKFIEVTDSDIKNIGINWTSLDSYGVSAGPFNRAWERSRGTTQTTGTTGGAGGAVTTQTGGQNFTSRIDTALFSADEFSVLLSALETKNDIELVSNPTVVALNNTTAKIAIGERYPLPEYSFNAQTGERQLTGFEFIDIGINLDVIPSVNDAGFINLDIIPEVSSIGEPVIVEGTEIPRINSRRTETNITIKDGYTLAIGGLSSEDINNNETKVPLLGDLPGLGRLFRGTSETTVSRNLVIFITAKTLDPDGSTYRDVVDPRVLNEMEIVPSDLPGYKVPDKDLDVLRKIERFRIESKHEQEIEVLQNEVDLLEKAESKEKLKDDKKTQRAQKAQEAKQAKAKAKQAKQAEKARQAAAESSEDKE